MKRNTKKISLVILVIIAVIALIGLMIYNLLSNNKSEVANATETQKQFHKAKVVEGDAANLANIKASDIMMGDKDAKVTVIEYASLSCPHCADFYSDGFPKLKAEYIDKGKVKFAYRDFPLNQPALTAAMLSLCQADKNEAEKYHTFLKVLFRTQESWAFVENFTDKLKTIAKLDGMSDDKFNACVKDQKLQERILKDRLEAANLLQISSTPTFIINGEFVNGYGGYDAIKNLIEKKLLETNSK